MKVNVNQKLELFSVARLSMHTVPDSTMFFKTFGLGDFLDYLARCAYYLRYWDYFVLGVV